MAPQPNLPPTAPYPSDHHDRPALPQGVACGFARLAASANIAGSLEFGTPLMGYLRIRFGVQTQGPAPGKSPNGNIGRNAKYRKKERAGQNSVPPGLPVIPLHVCWQQPRDTIHFDEKDSEHQHKNHRRSPLLGTEFLSPKQPDSCRTAIEHKPNDHPCRHSPVVSARPLQVPIARSLCLEHSSGLIGIGTDIESHGREIRQFECKKLRRC